MPKPNLSPDAQAKLLAAAQYSADHPEHFKMELFIGAWLKAEDDSQVPPLPAPIAGLQQFMPPCQTTGCIGGNLILLNHPAVYAYTLLEQTNFANILSVLSKTGLILPSEQATAGARLNTGRTDPMGVILEILCVPPTDKATVEQLDELFLEYIDEIDADNVVPAVQAFIDGGIESLNDYLEESTITVAVQAVQ